MRDKNSETSSGNVFADIGITNPEEHLAKVKLAMQINLLIEERDLTQKEAAKLLGIDQPKISALHKGRLAGFSLERLFHFLNVLGQDINIKISPKARTRKKPNIVVVYNKAKRKPPLDDAKASRPTILARKKK